MRRRARLRGCDAFIEPPAGLSIARKAHVKDRETAFAAASNRSAAEWRILGGEGISAPGSPEI
jgi:hypothetical protein